MPIAVLGAAMACGSSGSSSGAAAACGSFSVQGTCTATFMLSSSAPSACSPEPPSTLTINAGQSTYSPPNGGTCDQMFSGCDLTRNCTTSGGDTIGVVVTFTSGGTYTGTFTTVSGATKCTYAVSGGCDGAAGPEGGASSSSGGGSGGSSGGSGGSSGGSGSSSGGSGGSSGSSSGGAMPDGGEDGGDGGACPTGVTCGGQCCGAGLICATFDSEDTCAQACADNSTCPSSAPCCTALANGQGACLANGGAGQECLCTTSSECPSGACAPAVNKNGDPVGPMICKPNDGQAYDGCHGTFTVCAGSYCCVTDGNSNEFCSLECTPGDTTCGAATCQQYSFSASSCSGPDACGP
jgi:hypothetical protein